MADLTADDLDIDDGRPEVVEAAHDAPPPKRGRKPRDPGAEGPAKAMPKDRAPRAGGGRRKNLTAELEVMYRLMGTVWAVKDPVCGQALADSAPMIAKAWNDWAQSNPAVYRVLTSMSGGAGPIGVAMAHLPLIMVVVQHHGPAAQQARQAQMEAQRAAEAEWLRQMADAEATVVNGMGVDVNPLPADDEYGNVGSGDDVRPVDPNAFSFADTEWEPGPAY